MNTDDRAAIIDDNRPTLPLGAAGRVVHAVSFNGEDELWIVTAVGDDGSSVRIPDHEQLGPLPPPIRAAIDTLGIPRCGAPRSDGQPCRAFVPAHGDRCHWHARTGANL